MRGSQPEAQLAPRALGGSAEPRGSLPLPAAVKGRAAMVWAEPKAADLCPTLISSLAFLSPVMPGGQGSQLTLPCPRPGLPGWVQLSVLPSLAPSRA